MTAGLPGAGIGGLFYIASTLLLPVRELARRLRGQPPAATPGRLAHSVGLALGIIVAIAVMGWMLGLLLPADVLTAVAPAGATTGVRRTVIPVATLGAAVATLVIVLVSVETARIVVVRQESRRRRNGTAL